MFDILTDFDNDDFIFGTAKDDNMFSTFGNDQIFGYGGNDFIVIAPQADDVTCRVNGGAGYDILWLAREPVDIDVVGRHFVISYDYDMTIIVKNVEQIDWS